jgi:thiol-disulfide isomerase/thioredoxin
MNARTVRFHIIFVFVLIFTLQASTASRSIPTFLDLGSKVCIPCKLMTPILDSLGKEFKDSLKVQFVEVGIGGDKAMAEKYKVKVIPTQIFLSPDSKELWRHEGYISRFGILDKWRELGYGFAENSLAVRYKRFEPESVNTRSKETICNMCDGTIDPKSVVSVNTAKGTVRLCGPHCFFIMFSCLLEDTAGFDKKVTVTDNSDGKPIAAISAHYLYGKDENTGRPWIKAFAAKASAEKARAKMGGSILSWNLLKKAELSTRCGFCDRAVYSEDAAQVRADGLFTWGCCSHCALGVAVRTGKDIEVIQPDRLTGKPVTIKTFDGYIESIDPPNSVAWFGQKKNPEGKFVSAGCFHQGFFTSEENLRSWAASNPQETGKMISIDEALNDKMKLTEMQIHKACKIGECAPK